MNTTPGHILRIRKNRRVPLFFLLFFLCLNSGCTRYFAYKTEVRDPQSAYDKMVKNWTPGREYILSSRGTVYHLKDVTFDTIGVRAVSSAQQNSTLYYLPRVYGPYNRKKERVRYDRSSDSSALLNQVFVMSDSVIFSGDTLSVSMASIQRIDRVRENHGILTAILITLLAIVGLLTLISTISFSLSGMDF